MKKAPIAVTGGGGFIGSRLVRRLGGGPAEVRALDIAGEDPVRRCDVLDIGQLVDAFDGCEVVYHLAGPVAETVRKRPYESAQLQMQGTLNVFEAAHLARVRRVILASSFYVYTCCGPMEVVNEETHLDAAKLDLFGASKLTSEMIARSFGAAYGIDWIACRFGSAYGWGRCSNIVQSIIESSLRGEAFQIWGAGLRRNQYTWVEDIVDGLTRCLTVNRACVNQVYNLISPEVTTTGDLAELMRASYGFETLFDDDRPDPPSTPFMASHKAEMMLDWRPSTLKKGLDAVVAEAIPDGRGDAVDAAERIVKETRG